MKTSNMFKPSSNFLTDGKRSKAVLFCGSFLLFVFRVILSALFLAVLWSPAGKGLNCKMFPCVLSLSHKVSCVRCGI